MNVNFGRRLEYQFGFITTPTVSSIRRAGLAQLRDFFTEGDRSDLRIKLSEPQQGDAFAPVGDGFAAIPGMQWTGGVWRMTWTPVRFELTASATVYEEASGRSLQLSRATQRALAGLRQTADLLQSLSIVPHRPILIVSGEQDVVEADRHPLLSALASRYFGHEVIQAVAERRLSDLNYRGDWQTSFQLSTESAPVHRLETVGTAVGFNEQIPKVVLRCQWDVNSSPARGERALSGPDVELFFVQASAWIEQRMSELGAL